MDAFELRAHVPESSPPLLSKADFRTLVRLGPLVSIDLIIRDPMDHVLLGLRTNEPAKGFYFVPGGRIRKNEPVRDAFSRILFEETSCLAAVNEARLLGVHDHLYDTNRFADPGYGTHYVVLAYELRVDKSAIPKIDSQHAEFVWWSEAEILASPHAHPNTKAYFSDRTRA